MIPRSANVELNKRALTTESYRGSNCRPGDAVGHYDHEPIVASPLTVEALTDDGWQSCPAWIVDLTRQELWVELDHGLAESLDPGRSVRLVLSHPKLPTQIAETVVLWHLGKTGKVAVLKRPRLWDPPSRREHMRARLAVPLYLKADEGSESVPATLTDIGAGGLLCVAAMDLRIGQRLDVAVQLTPDRTFECQAEVARLDEDPNDLLGFQLMVGLQFLELSRDEQASLARTVADLARDVDAGFVPRPWRSEAIDLLVHVDIDGESDEPEETGESAERSITVELDRRWAS